MKNRSIHVLGVGKNTPVYVDLAEACGYKVEALWHYREGREGEKVCGREIVGSFQQLFAMPIHGMCFALSMGANHIRARLHEQLVARGGIVPALIHPGATVSRYAELEDGVVVHAHAVVQASARIHRASVLSFHAGVTHTSIIERGCYLASKAVVGGSIRVMEQALVGMGAVVISDKVEYIGPWG